MLIFLAAIAIFLSEKYPDFSPNEAIPKPTVITTERRNEQVRLKMNFERVVDGDTFHANGKIIRLWGINTPEKGQDGYLAAKMYLEVLLEGKDVYCVEKHTDRYKRIVMQCFSDGQDIGSDIVFMGMGKEYRKFSKGYYAEEEKLAKAGKRGVWVNSSLRYQ